MFPRALGSHCFLKPFLNSLKFLLSRCNWKQLVSRLDSWDTEKQTPQILNMLKHFWILSFSSLGHENDSFSVPGWSEGIFFKGTALDEVFGEGSGCWRVEGEHLTVDHGISEPGSADTQPPYCLVEGLGFSLNFLFWIEPKPFWTGWESFV